MPWKEYSVIDERLQLVAHRLAGEPMAEPCREFGISATFGGFGGFIAADTGGAVMVNLYTDPQEDVNAGIRHIAMAVPVTRRSVRTSQTCSSIRRSSRWDSCRTIRLCTFWGQKSRL